MKETISFTLGSASVDDCKVSMHFEDISMVSVKHLLQSVIERIDDLCADFVISGDGVCEYPDKAREFVIDSLNRLRVEQQRSPKEQG